MPRALIIDDEAALTIIVGRFLERAGFRVETATSGLEGLEKAVADTHDVVIVDVMMPGMDGYEVCRRLRADPRTARSIIVVLTARGQTVDKQMALQAGADAHAAKPFDGRVLVANVQELLANRPRAELSLGYQVLVLRLKGDAGATTVATNLALCLAQEKKRLTAVVDLVPRGGEVSSRLGLAAAEAEPDSPAGELAAQLVRHDSGLFVLPAAPQQSARGWDATRAVQRLQQLRGWYDYLLVDTPRNLGKLAPVLLKSSPLVVLLLTPDPATLHTARASLEAIRKLGNRAQRIWPVINHVAPAAFSLQQEAEEVLGMQVVTVLPWSPGECAQAVANHEPVVLGQPDSPLAREYQALAGHIAQLASGQP